MAISMSWGLAFGTFITLFATPILYNIFADIRRKIFKKHKPAEAFQTDKSFYNEDSKEIPALESEPEKEQLTKTEEKPQIDTKSLEITKKRYRRKRKEKNQPEKT